MQFIISTLNEKEISNQIEIIIWEKAPKRLELKRVDYLKHENIIIWTKGLSTQSIKWNKEASAIKSQGWTEYNQAIENFIRDQIVKPESTHQSNGLGLLS